MNRLFPGGDDSPEAARAAALFATALGCDLVVDLHEEGLAWLEADRPTLVGSPAAAPLVLGMVEALSEEGFAFTGGSPAGSLVAELGRLGRRAITVEVPARLGEAEREALILAALAAALEGLGMAR
jgi:predicted deacylase